MKKLFVIFLVVLVSAGLYAETKVEKLPMLNDVNPDPVIPVVTEDVGDLIWDLDVEAIAADNQLLGIEYDGTHIWVTGGGNAVDPNYLYRIDPVAGTLVDSYEQPAAATGWGVRDLAYDASTNKIYGGNEGSFFSFDIATETWTTEFSSTFGTIRALAFDGNHFWTKSFGDPIYEFGVDGTLYNTYADANSAYGFAYDSFEDCLWLFASTTTFVQFGLDGVPTGTTHSVTLPNGGIIGGAFYYEGGLVPGKTILGCLGQGTPDIAYGMELRDAAPLASPGAPTGVTVTPDAGGALTADIDWTCPTLDVGGSTLTDLDEMRVYRDGVLIHTDTTPTIGGPGSYSDAVPASGNYAYSVVGFNDAGEGIPAAVSSWVGEDVPNVVENLLLEQSSPGELSGTLSWDNPTTGLNGGAFNNAILGYHIERSDGVMFEVTGLVTEYIDGTIPAAGVYYYTVQPYNSIGDGGSVESNPVLIADAGLLIMEDFAAWPPAGWTTEGGTNWMAAASNNAGGTAPEAQFNWSPSTTGTQRLISPAVNTTGATDLNLAFMHAINDYNGDYFLYIQTTSDGVTWNDVMTIPSVTAGPELIEEVITTSDVGSATFQVAWVFDGNSFNINYWYVDDVMLTIGNAGDPGYIEGNVTLDGGMGDVEDVEVTAGGVTVNPDAMGDYMITINPGTYDVMATLMNYESDTLTGVVVTEGNTTADQDLTLTYIPSVFDPVENLAVDEMTGLLSWDPPGGAVDYIELIQHDGNNVNGYFQAFDNGYGVVYDVSGYTNVTVEMLDFRHSSWGLTGTWDYALHIVDWDTYTEIDVVEGLQTTVNDDWELEIDLGSVSASGLVGIFLEPQGNTAADAYPDLDSDDVGPDGLSYRGLLADYSAMTLSDIGDFLMDLWIMGSETDGLVQAKKFKANFGNDIARIANTIPTFDFITLNQTAYSRDLLGYDVYLGGDLQGNTSDTEYLLTGLVYEEEYTAGVVAVYDDGEAPMEEVTFTYLGGSETTPTIIAATKLGSNYPNPFNPVTNIAYSVKETGNVSIEVYNMRGQLVRTLVNEVKETGAHTVAWTGTDNSNKSVSSGVYFYKMVSESNIGRYTSTKKMILMK